MILYNYGNEQEGKKITEEKIDTEEKKELAFKIPIKVGLISIDKASERIEKARKENPKKVFIIKHISVTSQTVIVIEPSELALLYEDGKWKIFIFLAGWVEVIENIPKPIMEEIELRTKEEGIDFNFDFLLKRKAKQMAAQAEEDENKKMADYLKSEPHEGMFG